MARRCTPWQEANSVDILKQHTYNPKSVSACASFCCHCLSHRLQDTDGEVMHPRQQQCRQPAQEAAAGLFGFAHAHHSKKRNHNWHTHKLHMIKQHRVVKCVCMCKTFCRQCLSCRLQDMKGEVMHPLAAAVQAASPSSRSWPFWVCSCPSQQANHNWHSHTQHLINPSLRVCMRNLLPLMPITQAAGRRQRSHAPHGSSSAGTQPLWRQLQQQSRQGRCQGHSAAACAKPLSAGPKHSQLAQPHRVPHQPVADEAGKLLLLVVSVSF